jgi:hypothetical protein
MADESARSNVLAPLRELGLIDEASKPTPIAERWRHDDEYKAVCHEIRAKVYPHELVEAFPDPDLGQRESIKNWFMKVGQVGEVAARMYTDTFMLLSEADFSRIDEKAATPSIPKAPRSTAKPQSKVQAPILPEATSSVQSSSPTAPVVVVDQAGEKRCFPSIHIDVQVHISPDTTPEQIDRIFESMAKHLGSFVK